MLGAITTHSRDNNPPLEMEQESLSLFERYQFFLQLGTMFGSGCPLVDSLDSMSRAESNPRTAQIALRVAAALENGHSLSESLALEGRSFAAREIGMVKLAETTGRLHQVLQRLCRDLEQSTDNRHRLIQALLYPALALMFASLVAATMAFVLLPRLAPIFTSFQADLPWPTRLVLSLSSIFFWGLPAVLLAGLLLLVWVRRQGGLEVSFAMLPVVGNLIHARALGETASALSTLISSGATLDSSLFMLCRQSREGRHRSALAGVRASLRGGLTLSESLERESSYFPTLFRHLAAGGEETGRLDFFLEQAAKLYLDEFQWQVQRLTQLVEPFMLFFLGAVVGFLVLACFLPFYNLMSVSL